MDRNRRRVRQILSALLWVAVLGLLGNSALCGVLDDPAEDDGNYKKALEMVRKGELDVARAMLSVVLKEHPDSIAALSASAYIAQKQERSEDATKLAKQVISLDLKQRKLVQALAKSVTGDKKEALERREKRIAVAMQVLKETAPDVECLLRHASGLEAEADKMGREDRGVALAGVESMRTKALGLPVLEEHVPAKPEPQPENLVTRGNPLEILDAKYGKEGDWLDVTDRLKAMVDDYGIVLVVTGGDLVVQYRLDGKTATVTTPGRETFSIILPPKPSVHAYTNNIVVLDARYGAGTKWVDVTRLLGTKVGPNGILVEGDFLFKQVGDVYKYAHKFLKLRYAYQGKVHHVVVPSGEPLEIKAK